ncbi:hypothetical protein Zmor_008244 [Zophobas morio]|uniref:Uncharacterized protein n=1 Tax=Zophobas morio TaxID=2755281 RepID=A0AA38IYH3_9CUCU|nr:hypothetical protein Zmor_008244 [Zophobas morio]
MVFCRDSSGFGEAETGMQQDEELWDFRRFEDCLRFSANEQTNDNNSNRGYYAMLHARTRMWVQALAPKALFFHLRDANITELSIKAHKNSCEREPCVFSARIRLDAPLKSPR